MGMLDPGSTVGAVEVAGELVEIKALLVATMDESVADTAVPLMSAWDKPEFEFIEHAVKAVNTKMHKML
jgi:hypothetical protein